jgi:hypothetical protein
MTLRKDSVSECAMLVRIQKILQETESTKRHYRLKRKQHLRGMKYGAVYAILVTIQLLYEIALLAPVSSGIKDICCSVCTSRGSHKHLVPYNAAFNDREILQCTSVGRQQS